MDKTRQGLKNEKMKLYDDCLIFFLKKNICTDALPSTIQNDIFVLRKLYQVTCTCAEKAEILEYCTFSHSLWWEDRLRNIGRHFNEKGHSASDMTITIVEKISNQNPLFRKEREKMYIQNFNTHYKGLNRKGGG